MSSALVPALWALALCQPSPGCAAAPGSCSSPAKDAVISAPPSFYTVNKGLVWGGVCGMVGLASLAGVLIANVARRKRAEETLRLDIDGRRQAEEALRESEQKYHTLVDNVSVGVYRTTPDLPGRPGRFLQVNPALARMFGYATPEQLMEVPVVALYQNPDDRRLMLEKLRARKIIRDYEIHTRRRDGTPFTASFTVTAQRDETGEIKWLEGVIEDITDRKRMEGEILRAQKLESVGLLAGGIAHDFNNLLTAILANLSLAKASVPPGQDLSELLSEAEAASLRARDLTHRLLTFAKGGAPVKKTLSVGEVIRASAGLALSGSRARCEFDIPDDLWTVDADEVQLGQVMSNLVVNADQAMPGGGTISIACRGVFKNGSGPLPPRKYVQIVVQDQGVGVPEQHLGKIFDPFFTTKETGRGLGLATAYSIVKNHGGHITVETTVGAGSSFIVLLPASEARAASGRAEERPLIAGRGRILVMDDEEMVRRAAEKMLTRIGYEVTLAKDGAQAVELYAEALKHGPSFRAVVMDLTVPGGMGGREAVAKLIEMDPAVKAIASSGYSNDPVMSDFEGYGFSGVIAKPYSLEELSEALRATVGRSA